MNYYFLDVSVYTAQKNNAEKEAVNLIQKFHRFVISDKDLKPLVEFLSEQINRINKKHKRCTDIRFSFKEGYSEETGFSSSATATRSHSGWSVKAWKRS